MMDEFRKEWIGPKGLNVTVNSDLHDIRRYKDHHEGKPIDKGGINCQPMQFIFKRLEQAEIFKEACKYAGAMNGRQTKPFGKYRKPKYKGRDKEGKEIEIQPSADEITRAENRPKFYFRSSVDKETRKRLYKEKQERIERKNSQEYKDEVEARKVFKNDKVVLGKNAKFPTTRLDKIVSERDEKDAAHAKKKEDAKEEARKKKQAEEAKKAEAETNGKTNSVPGGDNGKKDISQQNQTGPAAPSSSALSPPSPNESFGSATSSTSTSPGMVAQ
ncbi:MAG: hypothetical protein GY705_10805 [Bacteroidetes bacterium]|nr:hypothetical protein [Bacteroidota bacterium]